MAEARLTQIAQLLADARRAGQRISLADPPRDFDEGFAVQDEVVRLLGQPIMGWKVIEMPNGGPVLSAPLLADGKVPAGGTWKVVGPEPAGLELEIAFVMARDVPATASTSEILDCIGSANVVFELCQSRNEKPETLPRHVGLADCILNAGHHRTPQGRWQGAQGRRECRSHKGDLGPGTGPGQTRAGAQSRRRGDHREPHRHELDHREACTAWRDRWLRPCGDRARRRLRRHHWIAAVNPAKINPVEMAGLGFRARPFRRFWHLAPGFYLAGAGAGVAGIASAGAGAAAEGAGAGAGTPAGAGAAWGSIGAAMGAVSPAGAGAVSTTAVADFSSCRGSTAIAGLAGGFTMTT
jgi:hypothetical protein